MKLTHLEMVNYRRFADATVEFPDGVIGIVGRNGSGKSTILEAIAWALFGHDAARTGKDLIRRKGADEKADCRVTVAFRFAGHAYTVTRELKGKSQSHVATVEVDGRVVVPPGAASQREATAYLERAFHMDRKAFFVSLVARQRELAALTDLTPGARQKVVMSMLRIDAVDDAVKGVRDAKREHRARLDFLGSRVEDAAEVDAREKAARDALAQAADTRDRLVIEVDALAGELKARREERDAWERKADEHNALKAKLDVLRERAATATRDAEKTREDLAKISGIVVELERLRPQSARLPAAREALERVTAARQRFEEAKRRMRDLENARLHLAEKAQALQHAEDEVGKLSPARKMLERAGKAVERARAEESALTERVSDVAARVATLTAERDRVAKHLANVRELGPDSACPTCTRRLEDHYEDLVSGFEADASRIGTGLADAERERGKLVAEREGVRARVQEFTDAEREYRAKVESLTTLVARRDTLKETVDAERARVDALAAEARELAMEPVAEKAVAEAREAVARLDAVEKRVTSLEAQASRRVDLEELLNLHREKARAAAAEVEAATATLQALAFDADAHAAARRAFEGAHEALGAKRLTLERARGAIEKAEEQLKHVAETRERQEKIHAEMADVRAELDVLERLAGDRDGGLLVQFKHHLIGRIRPLLSAHAGGLFRDLTEGKYADLEVDDGYELKVHEDGESFTLDRYSGGEGDLANLCLRLAVSRVLADRAGGADFSFIALDEIFGSQDEVRKGNILRALAELRGKFRQIVVITHVDDVKDHCEHVLRVVEGADGVSTVTME